MKCPLAAVVAAATAFLLEAAGFASSARAESTPHQKDIAQHGAEVMPFSLAATTHIFTKTSDGGIQQVVARGHDSKQVALIQRHLAAIARQFSMGDFEAPETIHGKDMPGLATLRTAQPGSLKIHYRDLPDGGEIAYRSAEPRVVAALHEWFDAQLSDHGHDAMAGHDSGMMQHHRMDASTAE
ncbi:aspartate carbamoyltransferase [Paraburkholderia sp. UYCP14C]|uniref:aspartate carbamoyltransferase n=1 Tax=Paraburkholderia sp. UYCP14C TaxID=2511130 RepID=UPI001020754A|nr:aspartate carbamoyltransferase [Paraburkholderia sp. UYCP14C]RZF26202.1 aspartate carbamoyltransferase [Paraburkholderia sp. UYCP14C]